MLNESFDPNKIVYANSKSKITLKSKKKLAELAAQVEIWNSEEYKTQSNKENLSVISKPKVTIAKKTILSSINQTTPTSSAKTFIKSEILDLKVSVKDKMKFFETLAQKNLSDKQELNMPKSVKNQILIKTAEILPPKDDDKEVFPPPPPHTPSNTPYEFDGDTFELSELKIKPISELVEGVREDLSQPLLHIPNETELKESNISENTTNQSSHYKFDPQLNITFSIEPRNKSLYPSLSSFSILRPSYCENEFYESCSLPGSKSLNKIYPNSNQNKSFYPSLLSFSGSGSPCSEFSSQYREKPNKNYVTSLTRKKTTKNVSRSISFSDKISVVEIFTDFESTDSLENSNSRISTDQESQSNCEITDNLTTELELEELKQKSSFLIENLGSCYTKLKPGNSCHVRKCIDIVKNNLMYASAVERKLHPNRSNDCILAHVDLRNFQVRIKEEYVFFKHSSLVKYENGEYINRLSSLYNVIMVARSVGGSEMLESDIYSIVKRQEAKQVNLSCRGSSWIEMFEKLEFVELPVNFTLNFELYCMHVTPKKYDQIKLSTMVSRFKKFYSKSPVIESPILFSNIGSFNLRLTNFNKIKYLKWNMNVPQSSPFYGNVKLTNLSKLGGILNIYSEVKGIDSWAYKYCEIVSDGIICGNKPEGNQVIKDIEIVIPFVSMKDSVKLCDYIKPNSFAVYLNEKKIYDEKFLNRKTTTSGKTEYLFMASADSPKNALCWCNAINKYIKIRNKNNIF